MCQDDIQFSKKATFLLLPPYIKTRSSTHWSLYQGHTAVWLWHRDQTVWLNYLSALYFARSLHRPVIPLKSFSLWKSFYLNKATVQIFTLILSQHKSDCFFSSYRCFFEGEPFSDNKTYCRHESEGAATNKNSFQVWENTSVCLRM